MQIAIDKVEAADAETAIKTASNGMTSNLSISPPSGAPDRDGWVILRQGAAHDHRRPHHQEHRRDAGVLLAAIAQTGVAPSAICLHVAQDMRVAEVTLKGSTAYNVLTSPAA